MREIKIKVKRKMLDLYDRYVETRWEIFTIEEGIMDIDNCLMDTAGQYTGLVDKNGVEIYEGDIVNGWLYSNCEVKFGAYWNKEQYEDSISGYGWYIQKIGDSVLTITGLNEDSVEVIGNIHNDK